MNKVVIAIDSFKGSLSSLEAVQAAAKGILNICPECEVVQVPVSDGGEGLLDIFIAATGGSYITLQAHNPLMELIPTQYGVSGDGETAIIEMATISGLTLIDPAKKNPMETTSFGTGELIKDALDKGFRKFIIGIGGSATNDAGLGMLQALGFCFHDKTGQELGKGGKIMEHVATIDTSHIHPALKEAKFTIACDVNNPFSGPEGAAYIYARQKGADDDMIQKLDHGMESLAQVIKLTTTKDISTIPGAGAAGGIGGAFLAFLNASLQRGIDLFLKTINFDQKITGADLIISGEGKADRQTSMGKTAYGILQAAQKHQIPVILIAGKVEDKEILLRSGFKDVISINPPHILLSQAIEPEFAKKQIMRTVTQIYQECIL